MSLDLARVAPQVTAMISRLRNSRDDRRQRLRYALDTIASPAIDLDDLKRKIAESRTTWLVPDLVDELNKSYPVPPGPTDFTVIGCDGSHIDVDRHRSARCFLINIGSAAINYGSHPDAELSSLPRLYSDEKELAISIPGGGREQAIEGTLLGIKRSVDECRCLAENAARIPPGGKCLALLDGTLTLWGLSSENYPDFVKDALLDNGLLKYLKEIRRLNRDRQVAPASYISFPRSTEVVNTLRVAVCPQDVIDTDTTCQGCASRECERLSGVLDRDIFMELLETGERSALFISPSKIVKERYGEHAVCLFYLKVGEEIARVELPRWAAENRELLELTHALVIDQCRRGHGYPVVLSEAHEQAVVTGADHEAFWELVESSLVEEHLPSPGSAKNLSKRTRWV